MPTSATVCLFTQLKLLERLYKQYTNANTIGKKEKLPHSQLWQIFDKLIVDKNLEVKFYIVNRKQRWMEQIERKIKNSSVDSLLNLDSFYRFSNFCNTSFKKNVWNNGKREF